MSVRMRLMMLLAVAAMTLAVAMPALADDREDAEEYCWYRTDTWAEFEDCVEWYLEEVADGEDEEDGELAELLEEEEFRHFLAGLDAEESDELFDALEDEDEDEEEEDDNSFDFGSD
jgi:hypothetical protein